MRAHRVIAVLAAAAVVVVVGAGPAVAAPLDDQWVFNAWEIEEEVWPSGRGDGMTVAIIESGVAPIPDLEGVLLPGVDTYDGSTDGRVDFTPDGHGTAMAAMIASQGTNTGLLGIAPEAKILPVTIDHDEPAPLQPFTDGIRWAVDHGAEVLNISLGFDGSSYPSGCPAEVQAAVTYAIEQGAVVVAAAGNEAQQGNRVNYPAACLGVLAVGAVDPEAQPWVGSQRQLYVDVAAPGVDILSLDQQSRLTTGTGTSNASALTAGAVALVWSAYPELTNRQVVARILATLLGKAPEGVKDPQRGYGTVRPHEAILQDVPLDAPNPVFDELDTLVEPEPGGPPADGPGGNDGGGGDDEAAPPGGDDDGSMIVPIGIGVGVGLLLVLVVALLVSKRRRPTPLGVAGPNAIPSAPWPPPHQPSPWTQSSEPPPAYGPRPPPTTPPQQ